MYNDLPGGRAPNLWPLLTGGHCSKVALCYKNNIGTPKWWSLEAVGSDSTVHTNNNVMPEILPIFEFILG